MKTKTILLFLAVLSICSCAPEVVVKQRVEQEISADRMAEEIFLSAERLFESGQLNDAAALYGKYLKILPRGPRSDVALYKSGLIFLKQASWKRAYDAFSKLVSEFPKSPRYKDAKVMILEAMYELKEYEAVIEEGRKLLDSFISRPRVIRIYRTVSLAYYGIGDNLKAFDFIAMAANIATPSELKRIFMTAKNILPRLSTDELLLLAQRHDNNPLTPYLLYHLGVNLANEERLELSLKHLTDFVKRYPHHESTEEAKELIKEMEKRAQFDRRTIGCMLPLSGRLSRIGKRALDGIMLAFNDFSEKSGANGFRIIIKDTKGDARTAQEAVSDFKSLGVAAILGPIVTAAPAAEKAQEFGIPIMVLSQKENLPELGEYVFRNFITPYMQVNALLSYLSDTLGIKDYAILYPEEPYGEKFLQLFWDEAVARGCSIKGVESYDPQLTDFSEPVKRLAGIAPPYNGEIDPDTAERLRTFDHIEDDLGETDDEPPVDFFSPTSLVDFDAIFIPDSYKKAALIIPQLAYNDIYRVYLLGTNLWHSKKIIEMAGEFLTRTLIPDGFTAAGKSEKLSRFLSAFQRTYTRSPDFIEAIAYDSTMILLDVIRNPGIIFRSSIKDRLKGLSNYDGITGITSFDKGGEVHKTIFLLGVKNKEFYQVAP